MREIPSAYNPKATEDKWYKLWESKKLFHVEPDPERKPYTIFMPLRSLVFAGSWGFDNFLSHVPLIRKMAFAVRIKAEKVE